MRLWCLAIALMMHSCWAIALDSIPADDKDWESLISFRPSTSLQTSLAQRSVNGIAWRPLRIENGLGVTNLDFYGIEIDEMPIVANKPLNRPQLLAFIRQNFVNLIDSTQSDFLPYNAIDSAAWASANPYGAVMRFRLKFKNVPVEGGSVVVAESTPEEWRFTTIYTEEDWNHPVSGTREFGVTALADGSTILYTMGADRPTNFWDAYVTEATANEIKSILKKMGYDSIEDSIPSLLQSGEKIWEEYQRRVVALVNSNGGRAHALSPITRRPQWANLQAYYHPTVPWLGNYAVVVWDGPSGETILPVKTSFGRAVGEVGADSDHPRGVIWVDGNFNSLPDPGETAYLPDNGKPSEVTDLGRDGVALGMLGRRFASPQASLWPMGSELQRITVPGSLSSHFDAWIDSGEIAGTMQVATPDGEDYTEISRAFIWKDSNGDRAIDANELTLLQPLVAGFPTEVMAASSTGSVVGTAIDANKAVRAVLWHDDGTVVSLGAFTSGNSIPTSVNKSSQVVGYSEVKGGTHGFLWTSGSLLDLGTLGGKNSYANSINDVGTIVGSAQDASGDKHGVVWNGMKIERLDELVMPADIEIIDARFVDDDGLILVSGIRKNGAACAAFVIPLH